MTYMRARQIITDYGWTPVTGNCHDGIEPCGDFPEISYCSVDAPYFCEMHFSRRDRCLDIQTTGGQPEATTTDTRVQAVQFYQGPCLKGQ